MMVLLLLLTIFSQTPQLNPGPEWAVARIVGLEYPKLALQSRMSGTVRIACTIGADGSVIKTEILEIQPDQKAVRGVLAKEATENAKQWRFLWIDAAAPERSQNKIILTYKFVLEGVTRSVPKTQFLFEYPGSITLKSEALGMIPN